MALVSLARRTTTTTLTRLLLPLQPLLNPPSSLLPSPPPPPPPPPPPILFSSYTSSSFSATPPQSLHQQPSKAYLQSPLLSAPHLHPLLLEAGDFHDDYDEPIDSADGPELQSFLRLLSQARTQFSSKEEALGFLTTSGVRPTKGLVSSAIWELRRDWESGVLAFRWGQECLLDCPGAWHLMIWVLGKHGRFNLAWHLVRRMYRRNILTCRPLLIMMERYAAANEARKVIKTFHAMEKFKLTTNSTAFYTLLRALCKHRNVEEAEELLLSYRKLFPLETESFNIILDGWCNIIADVVEAKRLWREMSTCCINPDGTSYTYMICCFSKVGNLFDSLRLYDEMKKRGWVPNLRVYNSLIYILTKENCIKEAKKLFDSIKEVGLKADVVTYNSIIYPLCEAQKLEEARDMLEDMIKKGLDPTIETYHAFAKVEDMEGTLNLIKRMRDVGCGPNRYTFLLIFDKFFRLDQAGNALRMWSEMRRYDIKPYSSHYIALVQGLASCGWIPKAWEFYNEMKSKGIAADPKLEKFFKQSISRIKNYRASGGKKFVRSQYGKDS